MFKKGLQMDELLNKPSLSPIKFYWDDEDPGQNENQDDEDDDYDDPL